MWIIDIPTLAQKNEIRIQDTTSESHSASGNVLSQSSALINPIELEITDTPCKIKLEQSGCTRDG